MAGQLMKKVLLAVALALASVACAERGIQESSAPRAVYELSELDTIAQRFVDDEWVTGLAIALVQGDRIEIHGYGGATKAGAVPDAHTLFEIGSVTKPPADDDSGFRH